METRERAVLLTLHFRPLFPFTIFLARKPTISNHKSCFYANAKPQRALNIALDSKNTCFSLRCCRCSRYSVKITPRRALSILHKFLQWSFYFFAIISFFAFSERTERIFMLACQLAVKATNERNLSALAIICIVDCWKLLENSRR